MADTKLTGLTATTTPDATDLLYIVTDVSGTPTSKKIAHSDALFGLQAASVNLTNAQLLALFTTPITLVAAGGANTIIQVLTVSVALDNAAGVYTGGGNMIVRIGTTPSLGILANTTFFTADAAASKLTWNPMGSSALTSAHVNAALVVSNNTADFGGGNAANKATVKVIYRILTTLPA